jgi:FkbM family methyltransferase
MFYRPEDSDVEAFLQVFVRQEYDRIGDVDPAGLILDCGANVGYTTAWLLARYPNAHVIAVEPHPDNFRMLQRNLSPFGSSVTLVQGAVWSHECGLVYDRAGFRDGLSWATRVREASDGETATIRGFTVESLLKDREPSRIALLKMDVEGSEAVIFAGRPEWIGQCDNIAIELHDERCSELFFAAIAGEGFTVVKDGELTFCKR